MCTRPPAAGAPVPVAVHPAVEPLTWILGQWIGSGEGVYPTIPTFQYREVSSVVRRVDVMLV
jgi:hypothetical protein